MDPQLGVPDDAPSSLGRWESGVNECPTEVPNGGKRGSRPADHQDAYGERIHYQSSVTAEAV